MLKPLLGGEFCAFSASRDLWKTHVGAALRG